MAHLGFHLDVYKEKLGFFILLILSTKLMETADISKFIAGLLGSYVFLYLYKQSFSSE